MWEYTRREATRELEPVAFQVAQGCLCPPWDRNPAPAVSFSAKCSRSKLLQKITQKPQAVAVPLCFFGSKTPRSTSLRRRMKRPISPHRRARKGSVVLTQCRGKSHRRLRGSTQHLQMPANSESKYLLDTSRDSADAVWIC